MATPEKLDLYKAYRSEYVTPKKSTLVEVGPARYLTVDGQGEPGGAAFTSAVGALYAASYTIKMASKAAGRDYKVAHLEGLWWTDTGDFMATPKSQWEWKLMIRVPDFIGPDELDRAKASLKSKGKLAPDIEVRLEDIEEGSCVQLLHVGPYDREEESIRSMAAYAVAEGMELHGRHHELYLSDPRRVAPERIRTILRHPVRPGGTG